MGLIGWKDLTYVVNHLTLLCFSSFFTFYWWQKFGDHLSIFLKLYLPWYCSFNGLTLSRLVLLLKVLCLVVFVATYLQIDLHLVRYCPYCWGLTSSWPSSNNQCKELPLVLSDILIDLAWFFRVIIVYKTVRFFTYLILVLKKCI